MEETSNARIDSVKSFPNAPKNTAISDELSRILSLLQDASPSDASICFHFDGTLRVHIDVRKQEELVKLSALLPTIGHGLFHDITRGATPHHPFFHRISALVDR